MQELLSGAFLFKNVICVINGRICFWLVSVFFSQTSHKCLTFMKIFKAKSDPIWWSSTLKWKIRHRKFITLFACCYQCLEMFGQHTWLKNKHSDTWCRIQHECTLMLLFNYSSNYCCNDKYTEQWNNFYLFFNILLVIPITSWTLWPKLNRQWHQHKIK